MSHAICLPSRFYDDHAERALPTPRAIKRTSRQVHVSSKDPALPELLADALHYSHPDGPTAGDPAYVGLRRSAKATADTLKAHGISTQP
jgi:hypothetical protein